MSEVIQTKTPWHLWVVGILAAAWNAFGCFDYFGTRTKGVEHIRAWMPDVDADAYMAYINGFPVWASLGWAVGVWAALAGTILLLLRNKLAVPAYALSLIGAIAGLGYQIVNPAQAKGMDPTMSIVAPLMVLGFATFLLVYSRAMKARGVLA